MPSFGTRSTKRLDSCHEDLQLLFRAVVQRFDCTILQGHRGEEEQNAAFDGGNSKLRWPNGKHNRRPSIAVDVAPYPIDWKDAGRFCFFAGYVKRVADELGMAIRWGGDWDGDTRTTDQTFDDLVHFELLAAR